MPINDRPLLVVSCARMDKISDIPGAMLVGVVDEPGVKPFYPEGVKQGIKRPFVELAGGRLRLANIYIGRPRNLSHQEMLQTGFTYRKAKVLRPPSFRPNGIKNSAASYRVLE